MGLVHKGRSAFALGLALGLLSWSILFALALIEGVGSKFFSLSVIAAHVRLLIVIPLLFLCESLLDVRLREFVSLIVRSGVVPKNALPELATKIARTNRWRDHWLPEAICLLATVLLTVIAAQMRLSGRTTGSELGYAISEFRLAGLWYWMVCLPLVRFLLFRWLWRIALWWCFLWRLSRLKLHLAPAHPDGAAGLGYLEVAQTYFTPLVLAISALMSASFAEEISSGISVFEAIYPALAITLILDLVLVLFPPCFFAFKLRACQERGLSDYSVLAARYVGDFDRKWLSAPDQAEPLLGTADLQSLADLSNSVAIVRNMRLVPVSTRLLITVLVAASLPMVPLLLFKYPVAELVQRIVSKLAGL
ncbi:hypothetical protein OGR47_01955 [Methylocystis sp. MJC1]|uniref:hypothetical protein n=1 Tax=Methylocystis sp. MJC1 TaxID=2654282 RepID=UPI001FED7B66|nr:hypothetical protein [Methylocystis sp. MJC1]UZX12243.1 hypothetical protein OGR47_01955 [Methylocystis sp. MJC1]